MPSLEETLVHTFLVLDYTSPTFFKKSFSITKALVHFFGDTEYEKKLLEIEHNCAGLLKTKTGRKFSISYTVLEQAYLSNFGKPPDTPIEFEITKPDGMTEIYELSLMDITNYLYLIHDKLLEIILNISKKHGISIGDIAGTALTQTSSSFNSANSQNMLPEL